MVVLIVFVTIIAFIIVDIVLRMVMRRMDEAKIRKEREAALDKGLRMEFAEAASLKRVELENPRARILAVDDEKIILESFRKILVLAGFAVDTVESGPEALTLVKSHDYDFVFTDLKMPGMDGVEVAKAVKHMRPDIDVIVITGYATIESAVEVMKYGALDYVQKPFTEDELTEFVNKSLIRRQDRLEKELRPGVHLITPTSGESSSKHEFNVPAGFFIAPNHAWLSIELNGAVQIGLDDFARKIIGRIDEVLMPKVKTQIKKGDPLFTIRQGNRKVTLASPVTGRISSVNVELLDSTSLLAKKPYEYGWICRMEALNLSSELPDLKIGADALSWYQKEIDRFMEQKAVPGDLNDEMWEAFCASFLREQSASKAS